jgi:hypothetical protein
MSKCKQISPNHPPTSFELCRLVMRRVRPHMLELRYHWTSCTTFASRCHSSFCIRNSHHGRGGAPMQLSDRQRRSSSHRASKNHSTGKISHYQTYMLGGGPLRFKRIEKTTYMYIYIQTCTRTRSSGTFGRFHQYLDTAHAGIL